MLPLCDKAMCQNKKKKWIPLQSKKARKQFRGPRNGWWKSWKLQKTEAQIIKKRKGKPSKTLPGGLKAKASPERKPW